MEDVVTRYRPLGPTGGLTGLGNDADIKVSLHAAVLEEA